MTASLCSRRVGTALVLNIFMTLREELDMTYLFVSHDLAVGCQTVDVVFVLDQGEVVESGPVENVLGQPRHWYSVKLMNAVPGAM